MEEKKQDTFLEIKKKKNQNVFKKRILIEQGKTRDFLAAPWNKKFIKEEYDHGEEIREEMECLGSIFQLQPTLVISYTREPFVSADNLNVRITFDSNVRYRSKDFSLTTRTMDKHVLSPAHIIMEIKYTDHFPRWLVHLIQKYSCNIQTFSKYCIGMEHSIREQQKFY